MLNSKPVSNKFDFNSCNLEFVYFFYHPATMETKIIKDVI